MKTKKWTRGAATAYWPSWLPFRPGGAHHQGPRQAHEDPGAGDEHFYSKSSKNYGVAGHEVQSYAMRRGHSCRRQASGSSTESRRTSRRCGTRRSGLSAHLTTAFWTILCVAFLGYRSVQSLTKNPGPDPEDEGVDVLPWLGHRGKGLLEVQVQDRGCHRRWQPFHWISWFSICPSVRCFLVL